MTKAGIQGFLANGAVRDCIEKGSAVKSMAAIEKKNCQGGMVVKATGIVRRIDELGRVVIPKEIRRTLRIREGYPLRMTGTAQQRFIEGVTAFARRAAGRR